MARRSPVSALTISAERMALSRSSRFALPAVQRIVADLNGAIALSFRSVIGMR